LFLVKSKKGIGSLEGI